MAQRVLMDMSVKDCLGSALRKSQQHVERDHGEDRSIVVSIKRIRLTVHTRKLW